MTTTILPTDNTEWGYFGNISRIETSHTADPTEAWEIASRRIAEVTGASPEGVRDFLDSRHGRHFADDSMTIEIDVRTERLGDAVAGLAAMNFLRPAS